jgi:transcriptional regulator with XRE-family HTH domain
MPPATAPLRSVVSCGNSSGVAILLRQWREKRGYSVRELAKRARVGFVTVSRIENDRMSPTVAMLEKLAKALGISARDFFPYQRSPNTKGKRRRG